MLLIFMLPILLVLSCDKKQVSLDGFEYPEGITVVDLKSENDCRLPECSDARVSRLKAKDVSGTIYNDSTINIKWQIDQIISLHLCNKLDSSFIHPDRTQKVLFSGDLYDACGTIHEEYPVIENYMCKLKKVKSYE